MEYLTYILNVPLTQATAVLLLIAVAERIGIPIITIFKSLLKINGNGNSEQKIDMAVMKEKFEEQREFNKEMKEHAKTSNEEVGEIKEDISDIKLNIAVIKEKQLSNTEKINSIEQNVLEIKKIVTK